CGCGSIPSSQSSAAIGQAPTPRASGRERRRQCRSPIASTYIKNVTDALERYLTRKHTAVRQAAQDGRAVDTPVTDEPPADAAPPLPSREQPERRAHRLARYEEVVALRACGASVRTIAARVGIGQRTVQRWLRAGRFPERRQRSERPGQAAPFAAYLRERWAQGCHRAVITPRSCGRNSASADTGCYGSVAALTA